MRSRTSTLFRSVVAAVAGLGAAVLWRTASSAYIERMVVDQTATASFKPVILGTSTPGPATSYTIFVGRIFGELDPNDQLHSVITDSTTLRRSAAGSPTWRPLRSSRRPIPASAAA